MKKIFILLIILLFSLMSKAQFTTTTLYESPDSQINIYIVSQGFTPASMTSFNTFVDGFINKLWTVDPYSLQKTHFRIIRVNNPSTLENQPAAYFQFENVSNLAPYISVNSSNPQYNQYTTNECYANFKTRMDNLKTQLTGFNNKSYIIGIFNNNYYTGGGGEYTFASTFGNNPYMYDVLIHEFSHTFGLLADEYPRSSTTPYQKDPSNCSILYDTSNNPILIGPSTFPLFIDRNVTDKTSLSTLPWKYLVTNTSLPICSFSNSCPSNGVGLYDGANYSIDASPRWYRSFDTCKMRSLSSPFCQVCIDLINERINEHLCYPTNNVNENFILRHQYITHWRKASNLITSNSTVGTDITVNYVSGNSIVLGNEFNAKSGSEFYAYIGNCSNIQLVNTYRTTINSSPEINSNPRIANINPKADEIKVTPNPSNGFIVIESGGLFLMNIVIYSTDGKAVLNQRVENQSFMSIDISKFEKGLYLINIEDANKDIIVKKMIVN